MTQTEIERIVEDIIRERGQICSLAYALPMDSGGGWEICVHCIDGKIFMFSLLDETGDSREVLKSRVRTSLGAWSAPQATDIKKIH
ncbi:MAG: hypothetical protein HY645_10790 [Acidobacteria bacterium]|nr:hypothetical protein [Acidobacteriota bacterium]